MPRTEAENKTDVSAAAASFWDAFFYANVKKFTAVTDESFVWTRGRGQESTRKQLLDRMSELGSVGLMTVKLKETVSLYGETAVVRAEARNANHTMTLVNQGGAWKIVALHSSY
jgi:hypothetical protein